MSADYLLQSLRENGFAVGELHGKRLFVVLMVYPSDGLMVALEKDGCYVHDDLSRPVNAFDLVGAGFDFTSAPAVTEVIEALREKMRSASPQQARIEHHGERNV